MFALCRSVDSCVYNDHTETGHVQSWIIRVLFHCAVRLCRCQLVSYLQFLRVGVRVFQITVKYLYNFDVIYITWYRTVHYWLIIHGCVAVFLCNICLLGSTNICILIPFLYCFYLAMLSYLHWCNDFYTRSVNVFQIPIIVGYIKRIYVCSYVSCGPRC